MQRERERERERKRVRESCSFVRNLFLASFNIFSLVIVIIKEMKRVSI